MNLNECNMKKYAIIVAGGSGTRMGSEVPKQFLILAGKPILMHTILKFKSEVDEIIVVLPQNQFDYWSDLCVEYSFLESIKIVAGGKSRFESVKNGLNTIAENGIVAVHDAVRPFVNQAIIKEAFDVAIEKGNAVVSVLLNDSIREVNEFGNKSVDRTCYRLIQTPQCFEVNFLKTAYEQEEKSTFTDDASVVESIGAKINLTQGSYDNIKITTPSDLVIGEAILKK